MNEFPNASRSFLALNPHLAHPQLPSKRPEVANRENAALRPELESSAERGALRAGQPKKEDSGRFLVRVTSVRGRLLDEDNLCEKYVVDCCRYAGLLPGDGPGKTQIEVRQRKVGKGEEEHTEVSIYAIE